jgi:hypothetical protein
VIPSAHPNGLVLKLIKEDVKRSAPAVPKLVETIAELVLAIIPCKWVFLGT